MADSIITFTLQPNKSGASTIRKFVEGALKNITLDIAPKSVRSTVSAALKQPFSINLNADSSIEKIKKKIASTAVDVKFSFTRDQVKAFRDLLDSSAGAFKELSKAKDDFAANVKAKFPQIISQVKSLNQELTLAKSLMGTINIGKGSNKATSQNQSPGGKNQPTNKNQIYGSTVALSAQQAIARAIQNTTVQTSAYTAATNAASAATGSFAQRLSLTSVRLAAYLLPAAGIYNFVAALGTAKEAIIEIDKNINRLTQILNGNRKEADAITDSVLAFGEAYGQSGRKILDIVDTLAQAGNQFAGTNNIIRAAESISKTNLAATFGDIEETTEGVIAALNQFNLSSTDTARILDITNKVAKDFAVEAGDIFTAIKSGGGAFASAGGNIEEFAALVGTLRQTTRLSSQQIGTFINSLSVRSLRPEVIDLTEKLTDGRIRDANGQLKGLTDRLIEVARATKGLSDEELNTTLEKISDLRGAKFALPFFRDLQSDNPVFAQQLESAKRSSGSLSEDVITGLDRIDVQLTSIGTRFEQVFKKISQDQSFKTLIKDLVTVAKGFATVIDTVSPLLPILIRLAAIKLTFAGISSAREIFSTARGFISGAAAGGTATAPAQTVASQVSNLGLQLTGGGFAKNSPIFNTKNAVPVVNTSLFGQINNTAQAGKFFSPKAKTFVPKISGGSFGLSGTLTAPELRGVTSFKFNPSGNFNLQTSKPRILKSDKSSNAFQIIPGQGGGGIIGSNFVTQNPLSRRELGARAGGAGLIGALTRGGLIKKSGGGFVRNDAFTTKDVLGPLAFEKLSKAGALRSINNGKAFTLKESLFNNLAAKGSSGALDTLTKNNIGTLQTNNPFQLGIAQGQAFAAQQASLSQNTRNVFASSINPFSGKGIGIKRGTAAQNVFQASSNIGGFFGNTPGSLVNIPGGSQRQSGPSFFGKLFGKAGNLRSFGRIAPALPFVAPALLDSFSQLDPEAIRSLSQGGELRSDFRSVAAENRSALSRSRAFSTAANDAAIGGTIGLALGPAGAAIGTVGGALVGGIRGSISGSSEQSRNDLLGILQTAGTAKNQKDRIANFNTFAAELSSQTGLDKSGLKGATSLTGINGFFSDLGVDTGLGGVANTLATTAGFATGITPGIAAAKRVKGIFSATSFQEEVKKALQTEQGSAVVQSTLDEISGLAKGVDPTKGNVLGQVRQKFVADRTKGLEGDQLKQATSTALAQFSEATRIAGLDQVQENVNKIAGATKLLADQTESLNKTLKLGGTSFLEFFNKFADTNADITLKATTRNLQTDNISGAFSGALTGQISSLPAGIVDANVQLLQSAIRKGSSASGLGGVLNPLQNAGLISGNENSVIRDLAKLETGLRGLNTSSIRALSGDFSGVSEGLLPDAFRNFTKDTLKSLNIDTSTDTGKNLLDEITNKLVDEQSKNPESFKTDSATFIKTVLGSFSAGDTLRSRLEPAAQELQSRLTALAKDFDILSEVTKQLNDVQRKAEANALSAANRNIQFNGGSALQNIATLGSATPNSNIFQAAANLAGARQRALRSEGASPEERARAQADVSTKLEEYNRELEKGQSAIQIFTQQAQIAAQRLSEISGSLQAVGQLDSGSASELKYNASRFERVFGASTNAALGNLKAEDIAGLDNATFNKIKNQIPSAFNSQEFLNITSGLGAVSGLNLPGTNKTFGDQIALINAIRGRDVLGDIGGSTSTEARGLKNTQQDALNSIRDIEQKQLDALNLLATNFGKAVESLVQNPEVQKQLTDALGKASKSFTDVSDKLSNNGIKIVYDGKVTVNGIDGATRAVGIQEGLISVIESVVKQLDSSDPEEGKIAQAFTLAIKQIRENNKK